MEEDGKSTNPQPIRAALRCHWPNISRRWDFRKSFLRSRPRDANGYIKFVEVIERRPSNNAGLIRHGAWISDPRIQIRDPATERLPPGSMGRNPVLVPPCRGMPRPQSDDGCVRIGLDRTLSFDQTATKAR